MSLISNYKNLPINNIITDLTKAKGSDIVFEELKNELFKKDEYGKQVYQLSFKEDDDLCIIYYNNNDVDHTCLEGSCRSLIIEKKSLKILSTQYNKILYNSETINFLKGKSWSNIVVQKCYEGTLMVVFNYNNKWYVTTRRCLNADESKWVNNKSYHEMFLEAMGDKFSFNDLDKRYCYHFVLVHHKNKNIVTYNWLGKEYKELFHILTTEKFTLKEIKYKINEKLSYVKEEKFNNLNELLLELKKQNDLDQKYQKITLEGYILRYYSGEVHKSPFVILKLQTYIYETLMKLKPNNSNIYQCFLELYQKDKLTDFLPYYTRYGNEVTKRIHNSMKNMASEVLNLYHMTRNKNNSEVYNDLTEQYKKVLYEIHGIYIKNRKPDFDGGVNKGVSGAIKSINVYDVYNYLKNLPSNELRQLYNDRMEIANDHKFNFINHRCLDTMSQTTLMFKGKK